MVIQGGMIVDVELKGTVLATETSGVNIFTEEQRVREERDILRRSEASDVTLLTGVQVANN
jgi:hypothetical protein